MPIDPDQAARLEERREQLREGGGVDAIRKRHDRGQMTARERIDALFDSGTFQETGLHVRHATRAFGVDERRTLPGDGVVCGTGMVSGRLVCSFSQDFTVMAGTVGRMHARKVCDVMHMAEKTGSPVVAFQDSGGARIQEGVEALAGYGDIFYSNVLLSGVVPQIAVIAGPCAGGAAYSPALMDFIIMTRTNAHMFITGPEVIRAVTGQDTTMDAIGSAAMHAGVSGNVHFIAEDDRHAVELVHRLLSFLPANNSEDPPNIPMDLAVEPDPVMNTLLPDDPAMALDVRTIVRRLVDAGDFLEVHAAFARNLVVGFGRLYGTVVGIIANQPMVLAGALDIDSSDKGARFIRFCNAFNIPVVTLVDVPGFMPGVDQERGGIIRHGAKLLFAYGSATVPKITVILRKAYGGAYLAMCGQAMGADVVYAWPSAEIAVMGAEGAVNLLYRAELAEADDRREKAAELAAEYRSEFASPYHSAALDFVTDIILPEETRWTVGLALRKLAAKRELRPAKKHGNIPL
ncbi:acyl-CoA carboxylase subunit beta [Phaeovibrio sulfidiphilus]|uniref:Acyl-CoA carboxylase subunit beta n=1 Tax=Phaeovibrio sulfidiphilus TaxID=1220600 RepID=A0A8J6YJK7_9PROT|nr:acyl-CoA carboxylase subunit beta [Phaeovibrio sulfidiphilus]MBE1237551.1 acyl-CoA carboxylase subunit beta [Phaeovibrio sulfidiphilus]